MPTISQNKPYRIGRSRTGLGLFATKPIKEGTRIIRYFGRLFNSWKGGDAIENKYLFTLNGRWTIDGSVRKNIARYINHSCKPNAESDAKRKARPRPPLRLAAITPQRLPERLSDRQQRLFQQLKAANPRKQS